MDCSAFASGFLFFKKEIDALCIEIQAPLRLIVGFSGGSDSSLLLAYLYQYMILFPERISFVLVIHIHDSLGVHFPELKKSEEEEEALFLEKKDFYKTFMFEYISLPPDYLSNDESLEDAMHKKRKEIFLKKKDEYAADRVLLGHHKNDQVEHFFIGLIRGASLKRMSGMRVDSGLFLRPFLGLSKKNILEALHEKKINFVSDPSNELLFSLRNKIRKNLLPILFSLDERAEKNILNTMKKLQERENFFERESKKHYKAVVQNDSLFSLKEFLELDEIFQKEILQTLFYKNNSSVLFNEKIFEEIKRFLLHGKKNNHQIGNIRLTCRKEANQVILVYNALNLLNT